MLDSLLPLWVALESRLRAEKGKSGQMGQTIIEYSLILAFIAIVALALGTSGTLRSKVSKAFADVAVLF
jgi:Flp pilus assembly pilin Flp